MSLKTILHILAAITCSATLHASANPPGSCYPVDIASPQLLKLTVAVIDVTTFRDPILVRDFRTNLIKAASAPGQRVVLLTFAGIARGQHLARVYDVTLEAPLTDEELVANARIGPFKASQRCVNQRLREHVNNFTAALDSILKEPVSAGLQRSEIFHFLHQVLTDFDVGHPRNIFVYSDGWQNSREMTFYVGGKPRRIKANIELKVAQRIGLGTFESALPIKVKVATQVLWFGLLAAEDPLQYADALQLNEMSKFWRSVLTTWGTTNVQIGPTLNNPKF